MPDTSAPSGPGPGPLVGGRAMLVRPLEAAAAQLRKTVDVGAWSSATSWTDRLEAVSWPRVIALAAIAATPLLVAYAIHLATRPIAYAPPHPSESSIELYAKAEREARRSPPPGLVEANQSWTGEP